jgi:lysophospholipase L1-like esterase
MRFPQIGGIIALAAVFVVTSCSSQPVSHAANAPRAGGGPSAATPAPANGRGGGAARSPNAPSGRGRASVAVVGDSLMVGVADELKADAATNGFDVDISAVVGREIPAALADLSEAATADLVVVGLGTNDAAHAGFTRASADALIAQALAALSPTTPVLWVNVYRRASGTVGANARVFDEALTAVAATRPALRVLDWAGFVAQHPKVIAGDGIHCTDDGYHQRAEWLDDAITGQLVALGFQ